VVSCRPVIILGDDSHAGGLGLGLPLRNGHHLREGVLLLLCRLTLYLREGLEVEVAQSVERWREQPGHVWLKLEVAIVVEPEHADIVQFIFFVVLQVLAQLAHLVGDAGNGVGIADVVCLDIRLCQQRVVENELGIETDGTHGREKGMVFLVGSRLDIMSHKSSEIGDDDAIVAQKQYFYVSIKFNHICKVSNKTS